MPHRSTSTWVAPPKVSFSRYNQVAAPSVHFPLEDAGSLSHTGGHPGVPQQYLPVCVGSAGGRDRTPLQPINSSEGPISSVSKANLNSYPGGSSGHQSRGGGYYSYQHKDHGASWHGSNSSTTPAGSININQVSPTQQPQRGGTGGGGGNAVYDFSQRVILTKYNRRPALPAEHADAPNTDYIYEAILGNNTSINNIINNINTNPYNLGRSHTDITMQGSKSAGRGRPVSISRPSPVHRTSASPHSETGGGEGSLTGSGTGGPRYRSRRPVSTKVVQVGIKTLPPGAGRGGGMTGRHGRGVDGFFPPVKLRDNSFFAQDLKRKKMQTPPFVLELAPEEAAMWTGDHSIPTGALRTSSAKSSIARSSNPAAMSSSSTSCHGHQYGLSMTPPVYPHVTSGTPCDDLTSMPRPRMMVSRGELPWVFRHKVKRSMNALSKIMASRPPQSVDAMGTFGYHYDH